METLSTLEQKELLKLLQQSEPLLDGTLGTWKTDQIELEFKDPDCKPYHAKCYHVPHSQEKWLKAEIERLCAHGIMRKVNRSEWASPMFTLFKDDGSLRSLADLRELN